MVKAIDGITDAWTAGSYLLEKLKEHDGFHYQGRFFVYGSDGWGELDDLELTIMNILKDKATKSKIDLIMSRLAMELQAEPTLKEGHVPFKDGYYMLEPGIYKKDPDYIKEHRVLDVMPFEYDILDIGEQWLAFLDQVFEGDDDKKEKIMCLQEFFGYCFIQKNYHKALVLYGDGGNGKSVILDIMAAMMPKVSRLEWSELADQRSLTRLADSWLNVSSEIAYRDTNATTGFKKAVAQEPMTANPKYLKAYDFTPKAKFAFATNGLPMVDDPSSGVFRRLIIIALNNSFRGREDWELTNRLSRELPGIFNWAMVGAQRLVAQSRFTDVPSNIIELQEYRRAINSLQSFYDEELQMRKGEELAFRDFYRKYQEFCVESNNKPYARNKVRSIIKQLGLPLKVYQGSENIRRVMALEDINY